MGSGDPDEEQQDKERLLCDPGKFSSCSSGTNTCAGQQRTGCAADGLHKRNKTQIKLLVSFSQAFPYHDSLCTYKVESCLCKGPCLGL